MLLLLKNELKGELNELDELMDLVVEMLVWLRSGWNFTTKCCWLKELWMMMRNEWMDDMMGMNWIELNGMEWMCLVREVVVVLSLSWRRAFKNRYIFFWRRKDQKDLLRKLLLRRLLVVGCCLLVVVCWLLGCYFENGEINFL